MRGLWETPQIVTGKALENRLADRAMEGINWKHMLKVALPWIGRLILSRIPVVGPALAAAATAGAAAIKDKGIKEEFKSPHSNTV